MWNAALDSTKACVAGRGAGHMHGHANGGLHTQPTIAVDRAESYGRSQGDKDSNGSSGNGPPYV